MTLPGNKPGSSNPAVSHFPDLSTRFIHEVMQSVVGSHIELLLVHNPTSQSGG
jgi:hypothetical protein